MRRRSPSLQALTVGGPIMASGLPAPPPAELAARRAHAPAPVHHPQASELTVRETQRRGGGASRASHAVIAVRTNRQTLKHKCFGKTFFFRLLPAQQEVDWRRRAGLLVTRYLEQLTVHGRMSARPQVQLLQPWR